MKRTQREWLGIGLVLGIAFGAALDNIGLGIALGLVFGAALGSRNNKEQH